MPLARSKSDSGPLRALETVSWENGDNEHRSLERSESGVALNRNLTPVALDDSFGNGVDLHQSDPVSEEDQNPTQSSHGFTSDPPVLPSDDNTPPTSDTDTGLPSRCDDVEEQGGVAISVETDPIDPSNAQAHFPPEACAFVANLPKTLDDNTIIIRLKEIFGPDGPIFREASGKGESWVILRRNPKNDNPFAFIQYKTQEEAQLAVKYGKVYTVGGRNCRTEVPRALRALYFSSKDGHEPSREEVLSLLGRYRINKVEKPSGSEKQLYGLGNGFWVFFDLYGEAQTALQSFKGHPVFHVQYRRWDRQDTDARCNQPQRLDRFVDAPYPYTYRPRNTFREASYSQAPSTPRRYYTPPQYAAPLHFGGGSVYSESTTAMPFSPVMAAQDPHDPFMSSTQQAQVTYYNPLALDQGAHPWGCRCGTCFANAHYLSNQHQ